MELQTEFKHPPDESRPVEIAELDKREGWTSASNADADARCPGRHLAQRGIESTPGADAEFGRVIHAALAKHDDDDLTPEQGRIFEACQEIERKMLEQFFGADFKLVKQYREQRLWATFLGPDIGPDFGSLRHSGQPDVVYRYGLRGLIVEYKTLPGDVPTSTVNLQLRDQVCLAADNYVLTEVGVVVVQPLVTQTPELTVYDKDAIARSTEDMRRRVIASSADSGRRAGPVQCKYCKAKDACLEYAAWAATLLPASVITGLPIARWGPDQCAQFCAGRAAAQKWLDECEAEVKRRLEANPDAVTGWCLKPGAVREEVVNPSALHARFLESGGTTEQFMEAVKIGKGDLEKQVRVATALKGKALKCKLTALLDGITRAKQCAPSLARKEEV